MSRLFQGGCVTLATAGHGVQLVPGVELCARVDGITTCSLDIGVLITKSCCQHQVPRLLYSLTALSFGVEEQVIARNHVALAVGVDLIQSRRSVFKSVDRSERKTLNNATGDVLQNGRDGVIRNEKTVQFGNDTVISVIIMITHESTLVPRLSDWKLRTAPRLVMVGHVRLSM